MISYQAFKNSVIGTKVGDGECVSLVVNNDRAYVEQLFPAVNWPSIIAPVAGAKDLFNAANPQYFQKVLNDANNPNQLPPQGAIMVFSETPYPGYANTYDNPYGHTGLCDSANAGGYVLLQQNAPAYGQAVNLTHYAWNFRHCIGWLIPNVPMAQPTPMITAAQLDQVFQDLLNRLPDPGAYNHYVGHYTYDFVVQDVKNSAEYAAVHAPKPAPAPTPAPPATANPVQSAPTVTAPSPITPSPAPTVSKQSGYPPISRNSLPTGVSESPLDWLRKVWDKILRFFDIRL